ncbi:hypothetical protein BC628DRAFT_1363926 [Trametes gibbosa]|nr:hypothetical protein BC628DRAFT_1363926 [Trametes gibbosa]
MSDRLISTLSSLPAPTLNALAGAGYETIRDLSTATPEQLSRDLNLSLPASQAVFAATRPSASFPMTQSAAAMMGSTQKPFSTACAPLDRLLDGGLKRGYILEINGPPGSGKEQIAVNAVRGFVARKQEVLFVDMQNMASPATIKRTLMNSNPTVDGGGAALVRHLALHSAAEFVIFLRNLTAYLDERPATGLLVLNSLAFPFQCEFSPKDRNAILERLRQTLARACASMGLSVIITSQLVTKPVEGNGQPGSAPQGSKMIMSPAFVHKGKDYLRTSRTYRVIVVPQTRTTGVIRLLSTPTSQPPAHAVREESYQRVRGVIV